MVKAVRIEQLHYIKEVANSKTLAEAAKKLHVTQPCLTSAINSLEDELGVEIFYRSKSGAKITLAGQEVLKTAETIIENVDKLYTIFQKHLGYKEIHIAIAPAVCNGAILEIIDKFHKSCLNAPIYVHETRPERIFTTLTHSMCSIGIFNDSWIRVLDNVDYNIELLYEDKFSIFASTKSPLRDREQLTCKEVLDCYPVATQIGDQAILSEYLNHPVLSALICSSIYNFTDRESLKNIIVNDKAIAALPLSFSYRDLYLESALWGPLEVVDFDVPVKFYMAYPRRKLSKSENLFVECTRDFYKDWPH